MLGILGTTDAKATSATATEAGTLRGLIAMYGVLERGVACGTRRENGVTDWPAKPPFLEGWGLLGRRRGSAAGSVARRLMRRDVAESRAASYCICIGILAKQHLFRGIEVRISAHRPMLRLLLK